jgi:hypothetical protein
MNELQMFEVKEAGAPPFEGKRFWVSASHYNNIEHKLIAVL